MTLDIGQLDVAQLDASQLDATQLDLKVGVGGGVSIPDAPSGLGATTLSDTEIDLAWTDNSDDEDGFRIERRIGAGAWSEIDSVVADVEVYSDTGLTGSTQYGYRVRARNAAGDSDYTAEDTATTDAGIENLLLESGDQLLLESGDLLLLE